MQLIPTISTIKKKLLFLSSVVLIALSLSQAAHAQETTADVNNSLYGTVSPSKEHALEAKVTSILESSNRYQQLGVKVTGDLVFIDGTASQQEHIAWAEEVIAKIEPNASVVNNLVVSVIRDGSLEVIKQQVISTWNASLKALPLLLIGLMVFVLGFFLANPVASLLANPVKHFTESSLIKIVVRRILTLLVILTGAYFFLQIAGLTHFAVAIISGTGLMGLILGFAFKDIAENFISSLLMSVQRPFKLGDVVQVQGHKGVIQKVTSRGTTLVDFDGNHIQIPNAMIYKGVIQNFTANPNMRGKFMVGIGYDADIDMAQDVGLQVIQQHVAVLDEPKPQILIDNLGASTVNLVIYFWVDSRQYALNKVASILMKDIVIAYENSNISMPDDAREVIFPEGLPIKNSSLSAAGISSETSTPTAPSNPGQTSRSRPSQKNSLATTHSSDHEDISSDVQAIQQQADQSPSPESGDNIL